ncbi:MAG: glycoside hydrolase family 32 protein [Ruminococcus sp.]|uniref:glycoside hydrolase family 32 protein n=1 Tax=Ruminococcus sp. TaxID=41978 RepID=UPI00287355E5|nr:glycoside hydrolase family 32 protein [Ruminococcus sp.]MBQ3286052.1 glycoside hydrolase family 32 protein [Ruminococcus sp.]
MFSVLLSRARDYETERISTISGSQLPRFHVTGGVGWINDPNGFSLYKGEYHLFYQYYPYDVHWNSMHWGHVKTRDFIRWERLPCALAPDQSYDKDGCFSGSAVELRDGRHLLIYTGVSKTDDGDEFQTQCLAFGDGVDYEKFGDNPVIGPELLPEGGSHVHFRDPKIWQDGDKFYVVAGNLTSDGSGAVLLFESDDALHWRRVGTVAASHNRFGRMWECPDLFKLDGKDVLIVSPQEMRGDDMEFIYGNTTLCLIGKLGDDFSLEKEAEQTIDYGLDFYAPQTVLTADGRRVLIAWMQYWNSVEVRPIKELPFFGQMTLPRELNVRGGRLIQSPVRELENYRTERVAYENVSVNGKAEFPDVKGRCLDMTFRIRPDETALYKSATVNVAEGEGYVTSVRYSPQKGTVLVDRSKAGWPEEVLNRREFAVRDRKGEIKLRFILDRYSLELFVNDGEQAASFAIFSPQEADGISFETEGKAFIDIEHYTLDI